MKRVLAICCLLPFVGCQTKAELRRQQELDRIKQEVQATRTEKADVDSQVDELKTETQRITALVDEQANYSRSHFEEIKREIAALAARMQALEQKAVEEEVAARQQSARVEREEKERGAATFDTGKKLFDQGKYEEAAEIFRVVAKKKGDDGKRAQYQLAESYFATRDFASAALEYGEFKKAHPKDALVPSAIFRQGQAFQNMGKKKEAKLFYQEVVDTHPKSQWATKAKAEMRKLK